MNHTNVTDSPSNPKKKEGMLGPKNPNWKGGRTIASNGYVLVKAIGHHLAHCTGYVYEHRHVAERKYGREIGPEEHIHHINGRKTDNRPENIEVLSAAEHRAKHRSPTCNRRLPDEPNPTIKCACGCGESFSKYDSSGRPRGYISGHNSSLLHLRPSNEQVECDCGCGATFLKYAANGKLRRYRVGHGSRTRNIESKLIECACGCGKTFPDYDKHKRKRRYVSGHNNLRKGGK